MVGVRKEDEEEKKTFQNGQLSRTQSHLTHSQDNNGSG